jgi:hypothetical protein
VDLAIVDQLIDEQVAVPDLDVVAAIGIRTHASLEMETIADIRGLLAGQSPSWLTEAAVIGSVARAERDVLLWREQPQRQYLPAVGAIVTR